jgi:PhnB protein
MLVEPYLDFNGRCEKAIEFYRKAVGAEVEGLMRFKDSPDPASCSPGDGDKVMHASLRIGTSRVMASDGRCTGQHAFAGVSLALTADTVPQAQKLFKALAEGGQTFMPMGPTFFAETFGMATDKFGVTWMVIVPKPMP